MPKQIYKIENFHGGLNSSSDPRDVLENELPVATDIMIDEVGKIRTMGSVVAHGSADEQLDNTGASTTGQVVGSGLFHFDHDRIGAEDAGDSEAETGDNYLALYDDSDAQVWVYSLATDDWDDDKDSNENGVIDFIGKTTSGAARPSFFSIDGAIRVSTGEFSKYDSTSLINDTGHFGSTDTTLNVDDGGDFAIGNYIKINDEIIHITAISTNALTVVRGMFGTKAVQHNDNTTIYILNMNQWYGYLNNNFFQTVYYSFTDATCDYDDDPTIAHDASTKIVAGLSVTGTGIPAGATVSSVTSATAFELSASTTGGAVSNGTLTFTHNAVTRYSTNKWYNEVQHLRSFDELGITLKLDDSQDANPDAGSLTQDAIVLSYWTGQNGFWSGAYFFGMTPVYIGDQEGPITTVGTTPVVLGENVLNVQLLVCHPSITTQAVASHPLNDDRIIGVNLYTKSFTSDDWFLLNKFDLLEGGEHGWGEYQSGQTTVGRWLDGSAAMADPAVLTSYSRTTVVLTVTPGRAMGANRTGIVRLSGFYVSPVYHTFDMNDATAQTLSAIDVINPTFGTAPFVIEILDENYNVLHTTQTTKSITDSGVSSPHYPEDSGYEEASVYSECFLQGTQILMSSGSMKDISDISIGDSIASYSSRYNSYVSGLVTDVLIHPIGDYIYVAAINNSLFGTPNHPILVDGRWLEIHRSGLDIVYNRMYVDTFYNLEVDGNNIFGSDHNYIANGFIVSGLGDNDILNKAIPRQDMFISRGSNG